MEESRTEGTGTPASGGSAGGGGGGASAGRAGSRRPDGGRAGSGRGAEDLVYAQLRADIEHGLQPGTPLRLSAIAARMGVSTMPVRAALKRLESDGLVRQVPRRGTVVAPLELDDIEEIQAIRWGIEGLAARIGAEAVGPDDVAAMRGHLDRLRAAAAAGDADTYLAATYDLEDACYAAAGRPRLLETVRHYRRAAQRYVRVVIGVHGALEVPPAERFYEAAAAGDGARTEALIQQQILRLFGIIADRMADRSA
ncbi:MAG: GntR family transcriptional regulator [Chloroflexota bacterium]